MKKLNTQGFAHQVLVLAVVVIAVIGGIGSYIYLRDSSASTTGRVTIVPTKWNEFYRASVISEGSSKVLKLNRNDADAKRTLPKAGTNNLQGLNNFVSANYGKKAQVCITAKKVRVTQDKHYSDSAVSNVYMDVVAGNGSTKSFGAELKRDYTTKCFGFTVISKERREGYYEKIVPSVHVSNRNFGHTIYIKKVVIELK